MPFIHDIDTAHAWLGEFHRPLLLTHRRPDGDAIGSVAAMALALKSLGKEPLAAFFEPYPARYDFLRDGFTPYHWEESHEVLTTECDSLIILDTCSIPQLDPAAFFLQQAPPTLVIDHHVTRDAIGTRDRDHRLFDETAGACALILTEWTQRAGIALTPAIATALFTGIATDCGWFRFSNTDSRMMSAAATLAGAGADVNAIYNRLYQQEPAGKLRLVAHILSSMELLAGGRLAVMTLRDADFARVGADRTMTEDLVNEAGRLAGVECMILFTEETSGEVRVNLRSKERIDVAEIARRFGGGGHVRAAGCRLLGGWDRRVPPFIQEMEQLLS
ncbi:MAG: exopolyphosphatase [Planctomycetota bacterium]